jgi:hypothetical protein
MNIEKKCGFLFVGAKDALSRKKLKVNSLVNDRNAFYCGTNFLTDFQNSKI